MVESRSWWSRESVGWKWWWGESRWPPQRWLGIISSTFMFRTVDHQSHQNLNEIVSAPQFWYSIPDLPSRFETNLRFLQDPTDFPAVNMNKSTWWMWRCALLWVSPPSIPSFWFILQMLAGHSASGGSATGEQGLVGDDSGAVWIRGVGTWVRDLDQIWIKRAVFQSQTSFSPSFLKCKRNGLKLRVLSSESIPRASKVWEEPLALGCQHSGAVVSKVNTVVWGFNFGTARWRKVHRYRTQSLSHPQGLRDRSVG